MAHTNLFVCAIKAHNLLISRISVAASLGVLAKVAATEMLKKIAILGLGNPLLTDDAVGLKVAERLQAFLRDNPVPGLDILTSTRAGFELIDLLSGYEYAIIVDAFLSDKPEPGKIRYLTMQNISGNARLVGPHDIGVDVAFELAKQLGIPMPGEVEIVAIDVEDTFTFSEEMTPSIMAVIEPLAVELLKRAGELLPRHE